jgi:hypothetical protein
VKVAGERVCSGSRSRRRGIRHPYGLGDAGVDGSAQGAGEGVSVNGNEAASDILAAPGIGQDGAPREPKP